MVNRYLLRERKSSKAYITVPSIFACIASAIFSCSDHLFIVDLSFKVTDGQLDGHHLTSPALGEDSTFRV